LFVAGCAAVAAAAPPTISPKRILKIHIVGDRPFVDIYRSDAHGVDCKLRQAGALD